MATHACRSCGADVPAGATDCPRCGVADPFGDRGVVAERSAGGRLENALKVIGCLVIAVIVLLIAVVLGLLDFLF